MGEACRTYGGEERYIQVLVEKVRGKHHSKELGLDERTIFK